SFSVFTHPETTLPLTTYHPYLLLKKNLSASFKLEQLNTKFIDHFLNAKCSTQILKNILNIKFQ
ncbi:hypothetical protein, partial [Acinetobacter pittii]